MINFCHIAPTAYLAPYTKKNGAHLVLAHLIEQDEAYRDYYANLKDGKAVIMDNGAFEMFKAGKPMYPREKLLEMAKLCHADYIVMSDYPKQKCEKTIRAAVDSMSEYHANGFGCFFCPQSELGDMDDLIKGIEWALDEPRVELIGLSILNAPVACGVEEDHHPDKHYGMALTIPDTAYRMQRFMSRWKLFRELERRGILSRLKTQVNSRLRPMTKVFHCLGLVDGPNEIDLLREYHDYIFSWDSSSAVWAGMNGIEYDKSPTGLRRGKFEKEVDFNYPAGAESLLVHRNIAYINRLCEGKR